MGQHGMRGAILTGAVLLAASAAYAAADDSGPGLLKSMTDAVNSSDPGSVKLDDSVAAKRKVIDDTSDKVSKMMAAANAIGSAPSGGGNVPSSVSAAGTKLAAKITDAMAAAKLSNDAQEDLKKIKDWLAADVKTLPAVAQANKDYDDFIKNTVSAKPTDLQPGEIKPAKLPDNEKGKNHVDASVIDSASKAVGEKITKAKTSVSSYQTEYANAQANGGCTAATCPDQQAAKDDLKAATDAVNTMRGTASDEINFLYASAQTDKSRISEASIHAGNANPNSVCKSLLSSTSGGVADMKNVAAVQQQVFDMAQTAKRVANVVGSLISIDEAPCDATPPAHGIIADVAGGK